MSIGQAQCNHCGTSIVDLTTQVVRDDMTYCCGNCAAAMEHDGGVEVASAETTPPGEGSGLMRCAHCGTIIIDVGSMESRGKQTFCCTNCARARDEQNLSAVDGEDEPLPADDRPRTMR